MCLTISLIVLEIVDIIGVAWAIDLHCLEKLDKLTEIWLSIYAQYVWKIDCSCIQICQTDHQQMDHVFEKGEFFASWLHGSNKTHAECLR